MRCDEADNGAPTVSAVVLAAGASRRFGSPKQIARLDGRSLLQRSLAAATAAVGDAVILVIGAQAARIAASLSGDAVRIVVNHAWEEGIASSIRTGIARLPDACEGALLMLVDQPLVGAESLQRLVEAWRSAPQAIVAARYANTIGAPAIFPRWCFADLSRLIGDEGARSVLHRYADRVRHVELPEAAIDIDRPEDLIALQAGRDQT
jgi:CTP:molybdopterin cytidylyltransferase MocA